VTEPQPDYDALVKESTAAVEHSSAFRVARLAAPLAGAVAGGSIGVAIAHGPRGLVGALAGAVLGVAGAWIYALLRARQLAKERFFSLWAAQHGLVYEASPPVHDDTPLLRYGDSQFAADAFSGTLAGLDGSVYQHTKRVRRTSTDSKGNTTTTNDDTEYIVLRLSCPVPGFRRLQLHPRSFGELRVFDGLESKLTANRVVELESEELARDFKLEVDDGVDGVTLRELFTPEVIVRLLGTRNGTAYPHGIALELEGSTLIFFRQGSISPRKMDVVEAVVADATPFVGWLRSFVKH
jgi:hypothetical protein